MHAVVRLEILMKMNMTLTKTVRCLIETDPNTGCLVGSVPNMAGANTQGQTLEELKANMHEVLSLLREHETIEIREIMDHLNLQAGTSGVIVHAYPKEVAYEVEFIAKDGRTLGVETIEAEELTPRQVAAIRADADKLMLGGEVINHQTLFWDFPADLHITCTQEVDGRYMAEVPELPGTMCHGSTQFEAMAKAQALALRMMAERLESVEAGATSFSFRL
jgi:predicted RNase H-like HicB family nuclease